MSEYQYINLLHDLFDYGERRETRNGTTLSLFGHHLTFDLSEGFPLLTTKKMFFKGIVTELAWFLRGCTDVTELHKDKTIYGMVIRRTEGLMLVLYMDSNGDILEQNTRIARQIIKVKA